VPRSADAQGSTEVGRSSDALVGNHWWSLFVAGFASSILAHEGAHVVAAYAVGGRPTFGLNEGRPTIYSGVDAALEPRKQFVFSSAGLTVQSLIDEGILDAPHQSTRAGAFERGVLAGGIATWNAELDSAYAFKTLLGPGSGLQLTHITDAGANRALATQLFNAAAATPQGRARLALVGALIDLPGWFDPRQPEPAATDYASQAVAQLQWESRVDFNFAFAYRKELETRAGGNPSWNAGVDYAALLARSPDRAEVTTLYAAAGMDLPRDLRTLNRGATIRPDAAAVAYLERNISFDGGLKVPVLSVHTTGDGLVIPANEPAYADVVQGAGKGDLLRQLFVRRAGHCAFTPGEIVVALGVLLKRLETGRWDGAALRPAALNAAATAQGASANQFFGLALAPSFADFSPAPYPRPHPKGAPVPA
jgi:hypothetical protein